MAPAVGGVTGGWQWKWGFWLLVRLPSSVFLLALVMVTPVLQMVGGWEGGPISWWFVRVLWLSVDGAAFDGVLEGGAGVGRECCRRCSGC